MTNFEISLAAMDILGEMLDVDLHVSPFDVPYVGRTSAERQQQASRVLADFDRRGLARRGRPSAEVEEALRLLGRAPVSASMVLASGSTREQPIARVASNGQFAVFAVQSGQSLQVRSVRPAAVVSALISLVRDAQPIRGRSVTFPQAKAAPPTRRREAADEDSRGFMEQVRAPKTGYDKERHLAELMAQRPRRRAGMVTILHRNRSGRELRDAPLVWHDTDIGRYMIYKTIELGGEEWLTYAPADNSRIAHQLELLWSAHSATSQR